MQPNDPKYCLVCEIEVDEGIRKVAKKAEYFENIKGDLIPVCKVHKNVLKKEHLDDILNE